MNNLKINDIKDLVEIPDYSFYIFLFLIILAIAIFLGIIYLIYKVIKNRTPNRKKIYLKKLKDINLANSKPASYEITKYGKEVLSSQRDKKLYEELVHELENFKYKKEVDNFDNDIIQKYKLFLDSVDV